MYFIRSYNWSCIIIYLITSYLYCICVSFFWFSDHSWCYMGCSGWPYCHTLYIHLRVSEPGRSLPVRVWKETHFRSSSFSFLPCLLRMNMEYTYYQCLAALACFQLRSCVPCHHPSSELGHNFTDLRACMTHFWAARLCYVSGQKDTNPNFQVFFQDLQHQLQLFYWRMELENANPDDGTEINSYPEQGSFQSNETYITYLANAKCHTISLAVC